MGLFKRKTYQELFRTITTLVLVSLSVAVIKPQVANATIIDNITLAATILSAPLVGLEKPNGFPVSEERTPAKQILVRATAYSSEVWQTDDTPCITANGFDLCAFYEGNGYGNTIAANFLPLGAQVRLPELFGDKVFIVRDRMNARYGYGRIDVWLPELAEAKTFGVRKIEMEIF